MITLDRLQSIIPADQALANKALATSLRQLNGINNLSLPTLTEVVSSMQTTKDLPDISALTTAVPPSVAAYYTSSLASGTGANGTVQVVDILGIASGWGIIDAFAQTIELFNEMDLSELTLIYQTMANAFAGDYGDPSLGPLVIPSGLPGAGTYVGTTEPNPDPPPPDILTESAFEAAMAVLVPLAQAEIANLILTYPTQTSELNNIWNGMCQQIIDEQNFQATANIVWADFTANDKNSIYGFIYNLPGYGEQTEVGGMAQFIERLADLSTLGGQAIVACLRQGRNEQALNRVGLKTNSLIPDQPIPPPPQADLLPSEYSESEASNLVIK